MDGDEQNELLKSPRRGKITEEEASGDNQENS